VAAFIRFVLRHRALITALIVVASALAMVATRNLRIRFQFRDFFDYPANQDLPAFKEDNEEFGDPAGYVVALVESDDVFRRDVLEYVGRLTDAIEPDPVFVRVRSLTNVHAVRGKGDEVLTGPLMARIPQTDEELAEVRDFALHNPLLLRRLVSADGRATAVLAEMRTPATFSTIAEQKQAVQSVRRVLAENAVPQGVRVRATGAPVVEVETTESLMGDQLRMMPAVMTVLLLALWLTFRSSHGVLLCFSAVNAATLWTTGIFTLFHRPVDIIGSVIPTAILVYGVVDPIFVLTRFLAKIDAGKPREDAIVESLSELALPCFLTSLTTALGFAAFVTASAPTIRYYGLTVAIGVLLAWVTTITVLPLLLSVAPLPKKRFNALGLSRRLDRALGSTWSFLRVRTSAVAVGAVIAIALGAYVARVQHVSNAYVGSLPRGQTQEDVRHLERTLSGVIRFIVHLEGPVDVMKRPDVVRAIAAVDHAIEKDPLVTASISLADLVEDANQAFHGGDPAERTVPQSKALVAQYLSIVDPRDRADVATDDYSKSHIAILVQDEGSESARGLRAELQKIVDEANFGALGVRASLTGNGVVAYHELDKVVSELLVGFVVAFGIIVALELLMFRSLRIAIISVFPNLLPVIACFVAIRVCGLSLRIDNALVLCVSIGGLFNTTIHFAARVLHNVRAGVAGDPDAIVATSMREIGPPALFTAGILSAGFSALMLSSFPGLQALGFLSMVTLLVAFASDMLVTAVLLRIGLDWKGLLNVARRSSAPPDVVSQLSSAVEGEHS
jgi:predicted RND superfamily exporter protein